MGVYGNITYVFANAGKISLAGAMLLGFAACAHKNIPLLKDYTNLNSADVVLKVMCETKHVIDEYANYELKQKFEAVRSEMSKLKENELFFKAIEKKLASLEKSNAGLVAQLSGLVSNLNKLASENNRLKLQNQLLAQEIAYVEGLIADEQSTNKSVPEILIKKLYTLKLQENENKNLLSVTSNNYKKLLPKKAPLEKKQKNAAKKVSSYLSSHKEIYYFLATFIKHEFNFHITEDNGATFSMAPTKVLSHGTYTDDAKAGPGALIRDSQREIHVTSTFEELWLNDCQTNSSRRNVKPKKIYPITGKIGIGHFLEQYMTVEEHDKIRSDKDIFKNVIKYTTDLKGSVNPTIKLIPIGNGTLDVSAKMSSGRKDIHKVDLSITVPKQLGSATK